MRWDLALVAQAAGGRAVGDAEITRVVTDSRVARPGDLFVAIRGERLDGHAFAAAAARSGAALVVETGRMPAGCAGVEVADTLAALAALAARRRAEIVAPVVAITGSSGKTTTKDLTAAAIGPGTHAAPRSYNNEVGVPITVLDTPDGATAVVVEVGSRGVGHITALAPVVRPDVAVITNIGPAHLEMFGDVATVLRAKWELVEILEPARHRRAPGRRRPPHRPPPRPAAHLRRGPGRRRDGRLGGRRWPGPDLVPPAPRRDRCGALDVPGRQAPAAQRCRRSGGGPGLGAPFEEAAGRVAAARVSPWRMEVFDRPVPGGSVVVVNDAYNANPDSMIAAFATVAAMPGRHVAVLGKMHELGAAEGELHRRIGRAAVDTGFETVVVVGDDPGIASGSGSAGIPVADVPAALALLAEAPASR